MTEQEAADRSLLYQSMKHLIDFMDGRQEWLCKINVTLENSEDCALHVFPRKDLNEVLTLGLEAYKKKHEATA